MPPPSLIVASPCSEDVFAFLADFCRKKKKYLLTRAYKSVYRNVSRVLIKCFKRIVVFPNQPEFHRVVHRVDHREIFASC
ncbi:unnamed protein product [Lasius platythorax]|uniref:Uncharacterized protein n=1 Tax=Lasius platythorax TaxID=488582 RepID=A0AAV2ND96_9HYME